MCAVFYKSEIEAQLSKFLQSPLTIGKISTHMYRLYPEIIFNDILIRNPAHPDTHINLKELSLGVDLIDIFLKNHPLAAIRVCLTGAKFSIIRQLDGRFSLVGLKSGKGQPLWLLQGAQYQLLDSEINWINKKNPKKKLTFKQVNIIIRNDMVNHHHQAQFLSYLPSPYGRKLNLIMDLHGDISKLNDLNGELFLEGENIQLAKLLTEELPFNLALKQGQGNFKIWGKIRQSVLNELGGNIQLKNLNLRHHNRQSLRFKTLKGKFNWVNQTNYWQLQVENLRTEMDTRKRFTSTFSLHYQADTSIQAMIKQMDLHLLNRLNQFVMPLVGYSFPLNISVTGILSNASIWSNLKQPQYHFTANFHHLSLQDRNHQKISNLSGSFAGDQQQGSLTLNSHSLKLTLPTHFRDSLNIKHLKGKIHWQQQTNEWVFNSKNLQLNTPYFRSHHHFTLRASATNKTDFLNLKTSFYDLNEVKQLKRYFPISVIEPETLTWLDKAFVNGSIKQGELTFYGTLADFPFEQNQGAFQVFFDTENLELAYDDQWPNFKAIQAQVSFLNAGLTVKVLQAKAGDINLHDIQLTIPSLETSDYLWVKGHAQGQISDSLHWLQQTPLDLSIHEMMNQLSIEGTHTLALDFKIPLTTAGVEKIKGQVNFTDTNVNVRAINLPISDLNGQLHFNDQSFYTQKLHGSVFGSPLKIEIKQTPRAVKINMNGTVAIKQLKHQFQLPWLTFAQGASQYQLDLALPFAKKQSAHLKITSNLRGIQLDLPPNLKKEISDMQPFSLNMPLNLQPLLTIDLRYKERLKLKVKIDKQQQTIHSANLVLGKGTLKQPTPNRIKIQINQPSFSPLAWLPFFKKETNHSTPSTLITSLEIKTERLNWHQKNLGNLHLSLHQKKEQWLGDISSKFATGTFEIHPDEYRLKMDYLDLSWLKKLGKIETNQSLSGLETLPLINISSQAFIWQGVNLGRLEIKSHRQGGDVYFNCLNLFGHRYTLALTGRWFKTYNRSKTHIQGQLKTENLGQLLKKLDFNDDLKESSATIAVDLNWATAPYQFSWEHLNGWVNLHINKGRIASIEPGFGRMLGVLAIEQWISRLKLDFSDIYQEGLSFNTIIGRYDLNNGLAYTHDLTIDAIPAKITLKGQIDLGQSTLDQQISIIPKSSEAIPIAGKIVGVIATTIAQLITGEYEEGFYLRSKYQVKGQWDQLEIRPLPQQDGLIYQAWRGLTDFSWVVN